jgi:D-serine deaminase-like pyridoxal phosphate-dependent protein
LAHGWCRLLQKGNARAIGNSARTESQASTCDAHQTKIVAHAKTVPAVEPRCARAALADSDLSATVKSLSQHERASTAALVAALSELDARRL